MVQISEAQNCDPTTPLFNINLTGQPNGVWTSPNVIRAGKCCSASGPDECLQFNITLDSNAHAINFNITSGAVPGGALFYQVNCGPPSALGTPICLNGPGPYVITFCKPGNNANTYAISSIGRPQLTGTRWVSEACSGQMSVTNLVMSSISWSSVPSNALYNSFLSCTAGCDSVFVLAPPGTTLPVYIDYRVCGTVAGLCGATNFCDTMRINFVNDLSVAITPDAPVLCFGVNDTLLTAIPSGGLQPFSYRWSTGATSASIRVGPGTYYVQLNDSRNCSFAYDTVVVTQVLTPIAANAGLDQSVCVNTPSVQLTGSVQTSSGGMWSGGSGTFLPGAAALNAIYNPSTAEINSGSVSLTLTTTGNQGCQALTDQILIAIHTNPDAYVSGPLSVCLNSTADYQTVFNSTYSYSWTVVGGQIISSIQNAISVRWNSVGTGKIDLLVSDNNSCDSLVTVPVVVNPLPTPAISGPLQVCTPGNFNYQTTYTSGNSYSWTITNGAIISSIDSNAIVVNYPGSGYSLLGVTETSVDGCLSMTSQPVQLIHRPIPVISGSTSVCQNEIATYSTMVGSGISSVWTVSGGIVLSSTTEIISIQWNTVGVGVVILSQSSAKSCDSTVRLDVIIHSTPTGVLTGNGNACNGHSDSYTILPLDVTVNYTWSVQGFASLANTIMNVAQINFNGIGSSIVNVLMTNQYGCTSQESFPVLIHRQPMPVINGENLICTGTVSTYQCQSGTDFNTWTVSGGTVQSVTNYMVVVNWDTPGQGIVSLHSSNQGFCDSTISLAVTIQPTPMPVISGPSMSCSNRPIGFVANGLSTTDQISWTVTGGVILTGIHSDSLTVLFTDTGVQSVSVFVRNQYGCDVTVLFPIQLLDGSAPQLSGRNPLCMNDTGHYSVPEKQGHIYQWSVIGGSVISFTIDNSIDVYWYRAGQGSVTCRQISPDGCDSTVSMLVRVNPLPSPVISGPLLVCQFESASFITGGTAGSDYQWEINGVVAGSNASQLQASWSIAGNYTLQLTETTSSGCQLEAIATVSVNAKPVPKISGRPKACINEGTQKYFVSRDPNTNYQWIISSGGTITFGATTDTISVNWTTIGSHIVTVHAVNSITGCDSIASFQIIADTLQRPIISSAMVAGCSPVTISINGNSNDPSYRYIWNFGDGSVSYIANPSHVYTTAGQYPIRVMVESAFGCKDSARSSVTVFPTPMADFIIRDYKNSYMAGLEDIELLNRSRGGTQYNWTFGDGRDTNQFQPVIRYNTPGNYLIKLVVTNNFGCKDSTLLPVEIKVPEDIFVPNAFTPNGDEVNDFFSMTFINIKEADVLIFNRWGEKIFASNDLSFHWDGTYKGRPVQQEVYVYKVDAKGIYGTPIRKTGKITLIR